MNDLAKANAFMDSIHSDIQFEGETVYLKGSFLPQQFEGVAKLSGGEYQFVIEGPRALVAVFDSEFEANEVDTYVLIGTLSCAGEFGLFPGINVHEFTKA